MSEANSSDETGAEFIEEQISDETETSTVEFNIIVTSSDWRLEELANQFGSGDIVVPDYQRKFVWDIRRASTLIESFAIGLPVPQVFFYENSDGELEVIDGQQRITSIHYFFDGFFGEANDNGYRKEFRLTGLEQRKDIEGKAFQSLDAKTQRKLRNASIRGVTVRQLSPDDQYPESVYHIFERLNTGGKPLNAQEIRNVVYRGDILKNLETLNKNLHWRTIFGKKEADPKQRDIELILRIFSLFKNTPAYTPPMKDFLSRAMAANKDFSSARANEFIERFAVAAKVVSENIEKPFRPRGILNAATLEAVMVAIMEADGTPTVDQARYDELLKNPDFVKAITSNTTSSENVQVRGLLAKKITA